MWVDAPERPRLPQRLDIEGEYGIDNQNACCRLDPGDLLSFQAAANGGNPRLTRSWAIGSTPSTPTCLGPVGAFPPRAHSVRSALYLASRQNRAGQSCSSGGDRRGGPLVEGYAGSCRIAGGSRFIAAREQELDQAGSQFL